MTKIWDQSGFQDNKNNNSVKVISDKAITKTTHDATKNSPFKVSKSRIVEIKQSFGESAGDWHLLKFSYQKIDSENPDTIELTYIDGKYGCSTRETVSIPLMFALVEKLQEIQNES